MKHLSRWLSWPKTSFFWSVTFLIKRFWTTYLLPQLTWSIYLLHYHEYYFQIWVLLVVNDILEGILKGVFFFFWKNKSTWDFIKGKGPYEGVWAVGVVTADTVIKMLLKTICVCCTSIMLKTIRPQYETMGVLLFPDISNFTFQNARNLKWFFDWFSWWIRQFQAKKIYTSKCNFVTFYNNRPS